MTEEISRRTIRQWLNNYDYLVHGGKPNTDDILSRNSGVKPMDGVMMRQLNKIMLEDAIAKLPSEFKRVVYFRWIDKLPLPFVLVKLNLTKDQYYYRCDKAVDKLWGILNSV